MILTEGSALKLYLLTKGIKSVLLMTLSYILQADNDDSMQQWISVLQNATADLLNQQQPGITFYQLFEFLWLQEIILCFAGLKSKS